MTRAPVKKRAAVPMIDEGDAIGVEMVAAIMVLKRHG
jgi:predicted phosphoribosyltransferase